MMMILGVATPAFADGGVVGEGPVWSFIVLVLVLLLLVAWIGGRAPKDETQNRPRR